MDYPAQSEETANALSSTRNVRVRKGARESSAGADMVLYYLHASKL
jgi:hypothetical protein